MNVMPVQMSCHLSRKQLFKTVRTMLFQFIGDKIFIRLTQHISYCILARFEMANLKTKESLIGMAHVWRRWQQCSTSVILVPTESKLVYEITLITSTGFFFIETHTKQLSPFLINCSDLCKMFSGLVISFPVTMKISYG